MERKHKYDVGTLVKTETYMKGLRYGCDVRGTATLIVVVFSSFSFSISATPPLH